MAHSGSGPQKNKLKCWREGKRYHAGEGGGPGGIARKIVLPKWRARQTRVPNKICPGLSGLKQQVEIPTLRTTP